MCVCVCACVRVRASTLDRAQLLDYTRAGVRRHLKSAMDVDRHRPYVKFNLVCAYVNGTDRAWSVQRPCVVRSIVV